LLLPQFGTSLEPFHGETKGFHLLPHADGSPLAEELVAGLQVAGFEPYLDKQDIEKGVDWEERLGALILKADTVVFIISPASVRSRRAQWEVDRTVELGKRLIPVQWIKVDEAEVPERLRRFNYTIFGPGQSFARPLAELANALRQDVEWIRVHTRLGEQAARWQTRGEAAQADDLLLRGSELAEARTWITHRKPDAPNITDLQHLFLSASEAAEKARLEADRQRLAERERLVKEAEIAQARTRWGIAAVGAVILIASATVGYLQFDKARQIARQEIALTRTNANLLAELSATKLLRGEYDSALRLALHGTRIDLALPSDSVKASPAPAALAAAVSAANWRSALGGHDNAVISAAVNPDGSRIVTASSDKTARIWDAATAKEIAVLHGHDRELNSAAFSPDGSRIVTASWDKTARIWDAATAKEIAILRGHDRELNSAVFSPDGSRIVTASSDKTARIWDAATAKEIAVLRGHDQWVNLAAFSPDGSRIVTASWDKTARIWDAATAKEIVVLRGHDGTVYSAVFSPDGSRIVTASGDRTVRIWDAATAKEIAVLRGHDRKVVSAAFSPDGSRIVTASSDKTSRIWDAATAKEIAVLRGHNGPVESAAFSPDGSRIVTASGDNSARIWDAATA
jgi:Tol biopolymer transport system component